MGEGKECAREGDVEMSMILPLYIVHRRRICGSTSLITVNTIVPIASLVVALSRHFLSSSSTSGNMVVVLY